MTAVACSSFDDGIDPPSVADAGDGSAQSIDFDADAVGPVSDASVDAGDAESIADRYRAAVMGDDPIAYWRMRVENLTTIPNEVDGANVLSLSGTFVANVPGALEGDPAVAFDGKDSYASATTSTAFEFLGTAPFTIEFWARHEGHIDGGTSFEHLVSFIGSNPGSPLSNGYVFYYNHVGGHMAALRDGPDAAAIEAEIKPPGAVGAWTYYAYVYDGQQTLPYIDGQPKPAKATKIPMTARGVPFTVGNASNEKGRGFHGALDEIAIYAKALPAATIAKHHATGRGQ